MTDKNNTTNDTESHLEQRYQINNNNIKSHFEHIKNSHNNTNFMFLYSGSFIASCFFIRTTITNIV